MYERTTITSFHCRHHLGGVLTNCRCTSSIFHGTWTPNQPARFAVTTLVDLCLGMGHSDGILPCRGPQRVYCGGLTAFLGLHLPSLLRQRGRPRKRTRPGSNVPHERYVFDISREDLVKCMGFLACVPPSHSWLLGCVYDDFFLCCLISW